MPSLWRTLYVDCLTPVLLSSEDRCRPWGQGWLDESDGGGEGVVDRLALGAERRQFEDCGFTDQLEC